MVSVNILISALQKFEGSYVVVSHDRHFISAIANKIWYIEDKKIKEYPGTYEEFVYWQSLQVKTPAPSVLKNQSQKIVSKPDNKLSQNADLKKIKAEWQKCEEEIAEKEQKLKNTEEEMSKPSVYSKPEMMQKLASEQKKDKQELEILHKKWEELFLKIEQMS
jgi:ATP-binding cassette subfamily F protein 3